MVLRTVEEQLKRLKDFLSGPPKTEFRGQHVYFKNHQGGKFAPTPYMVFRIE
jgi:hypothetical protein